MTEKLLAQGELDGPAAYLLANKLVLIPMFPRDRASIEQLADRLIDLCKGAVVDGQEWTPYEQATWLIDTVVSAFGDWERSGGWPAVATIFRHKFRPLPALELYLNREPLPVTCSLCADNGTVELNGRFRWCVCQQALQLVAEAPRLVDILNRPGERKRAEEKRLEDIRTSIAKHVEERKDDAQTRETRSRKVSALRRRRLSGMLKNWTSRILRRPDAR